MEVEVALARSQGLGQRARVAKSIILTLRRRRFVPQHYIEKCRLPRATASATIESVRCFRVRRKKTIQIGGRRKNQRLQESPPIWCFPILRNECGQLLLVERRGFRCLTSLHGGTLSMSRCHVRTLPYYLLLGRRLYPVLACPPHSLRGPISSKLFLRSPFSWFPAWSLEPIRKSGTQRARYVLGFFPYCPSSMVVHVCIRVTDALILARLHYRRQSGSRTRACKDSRKEGCQYLHRCTDAEQAR